jgi:hypothetical protein
MLDVLVHLDDYCHSQPVQPHNPLVYVIVNNGFIEGMQNKNVLNIMRHFTDTLGYNWRFGIGIGGGEFLRETQKYDSAPQPDKETGIPGIMPTRPRYQNCGNGLRQYYFCKSQNTENFVQVCRIL